AHPDLRRILNPGNIVLIRAQPGLLAVGAVVAVVERPAHADELRAVGDRVHFRPRRHLEAVAVDADVAGLLRLVRARHVEVRPVPQPRVFGADLQLHAAGLALAAATWKSTPWTTAAGTTRPAAAG